jgi:putative transcriptional regulator
MMARLDQGSCPEPEAARPLRLPSIDLLGVPQPLRSYLDAPLSALDWRPVARGMEEVDLGLGRAPVRARLLRLRAGAVVPRHTHCGLEMNLVLAGGYHDQRGSYRLGDLVVDDDSVDHRPVAERGNGCVCLNVTDAPLQMTGGIRRFITQRLRW